MSDRAGLGKRQEVGLGRPSGAWLREKQPSPSLALVGYPGPIH